MYDSLWLLRNYLSPTKVLFLFHEPLRYLYTSCTRFLLYPVTRIHSVAERSSTMVNILIGLAFVAMGVTPALVVYFQRDKSLDDGEI